MVVWDKFKRLYPHWDSFKSLPALKQALYAFLPMAEKLTVEYDKNDKLLAWLDKKILSIIEINKKRNRELGWVTKAKKISLNILSFDPAYHNLAIAFVASIRYGEPPPFTPKIRAWLKRIYGIDVHD